MSVPGHRKPAKYRNIRTEVEGVSFASKREAKRYGELKLLERAGEISALELQPSYKLRVGDVHVCTYRADFRYVDNHSGVFVIEDAKGVLTRECQIKLNLMKAVHGIDVVLV